MELTFRQASLIDVQTALRKDKLLEEFFSDLLSEPDAGSSSLFSDRVAYFLLGKRRSFLEIGAWDPIINSDTYWLESEKSWMGVMVEPNPHFAHRLRSERRSSVVEAGLVGPKQAATRLYLQTQQIRDGDGDQVVLGTEASPFPVSTVTLDDLFNGFAGSIDALFMDIEGQELGALRSASIEGTGLQFACVETIWNEEEISCFFRGRGFTELWRFMSGYNSWFVHESVLEERNWRG